MKRPSRTKYTSAEELRYVTMSDTDLCDVTFDRTTLTHMTLLDCNVTRGHFQVRAYKSHFPRTSFVEADLRGSIFHKCDFRNASLKNADLTDASFDGSTFVGTDFTGADLTGANLQRVEDLAPAQVVAAKNWEHAHLDPQLRRECELLSALRQTAAGASDAPTITAPEPGRSSWADRVMETFSTIEDRRRPVSPATPATAARATKAYSDIVRAPATKPRVDRSVDGELIDLTREL